MKKKLSVLILSLSFSTGAFAQTIADFNMEAFPLFLYQLINGTSDAQYAGGNGGPTDHDGNPTGYVGMIRELTGDDALGGGLKSCGYNFCADIPSAGNCSMTDEGGTFIMNFSEPTRTIPTGYTGAGDSYDKHVTVENGGLTFMDIEFSCDNPVGWIRFADFSEAVGDSVANTRNIEMYYDTSSSDSTKLELGMFYVNGGGNEEYFQAKFQTDSSNTFDLWITRAAIEGADTNGFRVGIRGNSSTKTGSVYMSYEDGSFADADTTHTDSDNLAAALGGDVMCIDYSDRDNPSAVDGACSGLAIGSPGTLLINSAGDMSIGSTSGALQSAMSSL